MQLKERVLTIPMRMPQLRQTINSVRVEAQMRALQYPQRIELVPQGLFAEDELRGVGSVQAVYAVGACYAVLEGYCGAVGDASASMKSVSG